MSNTVKERITVSELSKFGFKVGNEYLNISKHCPEPDKARIVPGASFEAELFVADSGKRYLNKILSSVPSASVAPMEQIFAPKTQGTAESISKAVDTERAKKFVPKFNKASAVVDSEKMSKADWSAKDRSQLIGGLSHDAAAIMAALVGLRGDLDVTDTAAVLGVYKELLEGMLKVREGLK